MWERSSDLRSGFNCTWVDEEKTNKEKAKQRETNLRIKQNRVKSDGES
jgi:hypothetical protein